MVSTSPQYVSSWKKYPEISCIQCSSLTGAVRFCWRSLWLPRAILPLHLLRAACCMSGLPLE